MADEALNLTFQQFLNEQKKTNQLIHQQIMDDAQGDNLKASLKNAAAEIGNTVIQERKNRKEQDQTQEAIVKAEKENTKSVEGVETAVTEGFDKSYKQFERALANRNQNAQQSAEQNAYSNAQINSRFDQQLQITNKTQETLQTTAKVIENDAAEKKSTKEDKKAKVEQETKEREMRLLKVNEEQYEDIIKQRIIVKRTEEELKELNKAIQGDAKQNKQYQKKDLQLKREQAKLAARENKRNLLGRFKTGVAASKPVQILGDAKRNFIDPIKGFFKKFPKILGLALAALLLFFVNSEFYEKTRKFLKKYFSGKESLGDIVTDIALVVGGLGLLGAALGVVGSIIKGLGILALAKKMGLLPAGGVEGDDKDKKKKRGGRFGRIATKVGTGLGVSAAAGRAGVAAAQTRSAAITSKPPASTNVKPSGSSGMPKFFHLNKFPALEAIAKKIPFLGTALSAAFLAPILMDDTISKEKKIQAVGGALGGVLGGIGGAKLGALAGFLGGGPIGALVGGILGSVGGFMFGDFVGLKLAEFLMTGKQPNNAAMTGEPVTGDGQKLAPLGRGLTKEQQQANLKSAAEMQHQIDARPERVKLLKEMAAKGGQAGETAAKELDRLDIRYDTPKSLRMKNEAKHFKRLFRPRMIDEDPNTYLDDRRRELERRRLDRMSALPPSAANQVAQMNAATADKVDGGGKSAAPMIMTNNTVNEGEKTEQSLGMPQQLVDNSSVGILANQGSLVSGFA